MIIGVPFLVGEWDFQNFLPPPPPPPLSPFFPPFHSSKTSSDYARNLEIIQSGKNVAN